MYTIVCLGRPDFLIAVLNGLAMLTSDEGPAGYGGMVALGLLIGVLLTLARAIVTQKLELQWVLAGWLLFYGLFVPKVTATVEDIYTGATQTVANVPLGPAFIGSMTSSVGVRLADAFGTVFGGPSMTKTGYMDSLALINAMRDMDFGSANDGDEKDVVVGVDLQRSIRSYLKDCVLYDINMNMGGDSITWDKLRESRDLWGTLKVDSNTWFTVLYLEKDDEVGQSLTCKEAYAALSDFINGPFVAAWNKYVASVLGVTDAVGSMQGALDSIFGAGHDAQTYMLNALLKREIELAEVGYQAQGANVAGVVMRVQAMEQRRTQWAAEQSMWAEMARPAIAFLEGFFYAASPFVGFMVTLGSFGITLFARYLLLAVWIQLWMPILSVCNLFITVAASSDIARLTTGGADPMSFVGLDSVWTQTASWLSFGGAMVAATPLLSLIVITGSYFALTSFTQRLAGGDFVNEKINSPDAIQPAPVAAVGAMGVQQAAFSSDPVHGMARSGVAQSLPAINLASDVRSSIQHAAGLRDAAERDYSESFSTGLDLSTQQGRERFNSAMNSTKLSGTSSQADAVVEQMMRSAINNDGLYNSLSRSERDSLEGAIGLGMGRKAAGVKGGADIGGALSSIRSLDDTQRKEVAGRIENMVGTRGDMMTQLAEAIQADKSQGISSRFFSSLGMQDTDRWASSLRDVQSATDSYERAATLAQTASLHQDIDVLAVAHQAVTQGWGDSLYRQVSQEGLNVTQMEERARTLSIFAQIDPETAKAASAALTLASGPHSARLALAEMLGDHGFGTQHIELTDPTVRPSGTSDVPVPGEAKGDVLDHVRPGGDLESRRFEGNVQGHLGDTATFEARGEQAVRSFFEARKAGNLPKAEAALKDLARLNTDNRVDFLHSTFQGDRGALGAAEDFNLGDQVGDALSITGGSLKGAWDAYRSGTKAALDGGMNIEQAVASGLVFAYHGWNDGTQREVDALREQAHQEGLVAGLPDIAARYYAEQSVILQEDIGGAVSKIRGHDLDYEAMKAQVTELLGTEGMVRLDRAATGETVSRAQNLQAVLAIYQQRLNQKETNPQ